MILLIAVVAICTMGCRKNAPSDTNNEHAESNFEEEVIEDVPVIEEKEKEDNASENNGVEEGKEVLNENGFFLFEFSEIPESFWDEASGLGQLTNKESFNSAIEHQIGDIWGPLALRTTGFSRHYNEDGANYILSVKDNDFIFWREIPHFGDGADYFETFYLIGREPNYDGSYTLQDYEFTLQRLTSKGGPHKTENQIPDIPLNEWVVKDIEDENGYALSAFYKVDDSVGFQIACPYVTPQHPYSKEDVNEALSRICPLISAVASEEEAQQDSPFMLTDKEPIELSNGVTIRNNELVLVNWDSGSDGIYGLTKRVPSLTFIKDFKGNSRYHYLSQWRVEDFNAMLETYPRIKEESYSEKISYQYKGIDFDVWYGVDPHGEKGYHKLAFECDGYYCLLTRWLPIPEEKYNDVSEWIEETIEGVYGKEELS